MKSLEAEPSRKEIDINWHQAIQKIFLMHER
jgi:hypothetical protein